MKNATHFVGGVTQVGDDEQLCSRYFLENWENRTRLEPSAQLSLANFLHQIAFPQRDRVLRFSNHHNKYGLEGEG